MVCCANKLNAMSFTLCKLVRDYEKYMQSLKPWAQWYSVYLSLLRAQRGVPSDLSDVLVASTKKRFVSGQEYLEVKLAWDHGRDDDESDVSDSDRKRTIYVFTNASLYCNTLPKKYTAYVSVKELARKVRLFPGGGMVVEGPLEDQDSVRFAEYPEEEKHTEQDGNTQDGNTQDGDNDTRAALGVPEGQEGTNSGTNAGLGTTNGAENTRNTENTRNSVNTRENSATNYNPKLNNGNCEPFESSEPFDTMDFTTTTDIDGQNIQAVERRLRQILDVTETNTEITEQ